MPQAAAAIYRLALALWVGGMSLFTFVVTPVIFQSRERAAAGEIVGAIFPYYFRYCLAMTGIALVARVAAGFAFTGLRQESVRNHRLPARAAVRQSAAG